MSFFGSSLGFDSEGLDVCISVLDMAMPLSASWRCVSFAFGDDSVRAGTDVCADAGSGACLGEAVLGGRISATQVFICASIARRNRPSGACWLSARSCEN